MSVFGRETYSLTSLMCVDKGCLQLKALLCGENKQEYGFTLLFFYVTRQTWFSKSGWMGICRLSVTPSPLSLT